MPDPYPDRTEWNAELRIVTFFDSEGSVIGTRPYTDVENASADDALQWESENASHETTRSLVKAIITDLKAENDRAQAVIDDVAATRNEKNLGRAVKRIADAAIDLARFVKNS